MDIRVLQHFEMAEPDMHLLYGFHRNKRRQRRPDSNLTSYNELSELHNDRRQAISFYRQFHHVTKTPKPTLYTNLVTPFTLTQSRRRMPNRSSGMLSMKTWSIHRLK
jgi:hypothetical protein